MKIPKKDRYAICQLIYSFYLSGAENLVYSLSTRLAERHKVIVVGLYEALNRTESIQIMNMLNDNGVRTFQIGKKEGQNRIQTIWRLAHILREEKVNILHTHTLLPNFYGRIAALLAGTSIRVATIHSGGNDWGNNKNYWMEYLTKSFTTHYVAVSKVPAELLKHTFGKDIPLSIIPNGIDIDKFRNVKIDRNSKRRSLGLSSSDIVLINVGRINKAKGQEYLVEAMSLLTKRYSNLKLLIVGEMYSDRKLVERLKFLIHQFQLENHVQLFGSCINISELLAISDIFVFSSLYEAMSVALLEATATGLPVVASKIPAIQSIFKDKEEIFLVPPGDSKAIADAISKLIEFPADAKKLACAAYKNVKKNYSIELTTKAYEKLYNELYNKIAC